MFNNNKFQQKEGSSLKSFEIDHYDTPPDIYTYMATFSLSDYSYAQHSEFTYPQSCAKN